jgi:EmrB/QacA subfamily drug resistance transporter
MHNNQIALNADRPLFSRREVFWTMAGVLLAMLLSALDQTVVGVAMPRIIADLGGFDKYTWVSSVYMITSAVTIPIVGKLSDMYGRKIFYIIGIAIFVGFSLACGFARDMTQLILFRGIQGIGGGVLMTNAFTVIADLFPPHQRAKYQGLLTIVFSFASVIGPTVGGFLTDQVSWNWVFFINAPLGAVVIVIFLKYFPAIRLDKVKHTIDYYGLAALILFIVPAMLGLSWGGVQYAWGSAQIIGIFVFTGVMLGLFLIIESRAAEPILPLSQFKYRVVTISNLISFLTGLGMFSAITFVPLFLQGVLGASATASGNMQIPMSIAVMITAFICGQLMTRTGSNYRLLGVTASALICLGIFLCSRLNQGSAFWMVIVDIVIIGFGMGFSMPVFTSCIQNTVPYSMLGVATSTNTFMRSFGGSIGLAVLGSIMTNRFVASFMGKIPENVKESISLERLNALAHNPQALVSPAAHAELRDALSTAGQGSGVFDQVMRTLQSSLSASVAEVFLIAFFIMMLGLAASFFLPGRENKTGERPVDQAPRALDK